MGAHNIKQATLSSELADLISSKQNELTREQVEAIGRILNSPSDSSTDTKAPVDDSIVEPASKDIVKQLITKKMSNSVDGKPDLRNIRFELDQVIKSVYGEMLSMLIEAEMDAHISAGKCGRVSASETTSDDELGEASNESNETNPKEKRKYRNGSYGRKVKSSMGDIAIKFPRDRDSSFNSIILPKGEKDTFAIEEQIWFLASQGNSARDIANTIERMMGCKVSHEYVNNVIAAFESRYNEWASRTLEAFYPFVFVDCLYLNVRNESGSTQNKPVYVILGINKDGHKDILDIAMSSTSSAETKSFWLERLDGLKKRGVKDILYISMDGVSGLEGGVKVMFPQATVQRCIVHLIRNSCEYVNSNDRAEWCRDLKPLYSSADEASAEAAFDTFFAKWHPRNHIAAEYIAARFDKHMRPLYRHSSSVRKIMYTTNAIVATNSSFREVVKKGVFGGIKSVISTLLLRYTYHLKPKWDSRAVNNWPSVRYELLANPITADIAAKYLKR